MFACGCDFEASEPGGAGLKPVLLGLAMALALAAGWDRLALAAHPELADGPGAAGGHCGECGAERAERGEDFPAGRGDWDCCCCCRLFFCAVWARATGSWRELWVRSWDRERCWIC